MYPLQPFSARNRSCIVLDGYIHAWRPTMTLPGLRGAEHIGFTVPDLDEEHRFFVEVIGCEFVYSLPAMQRDDDWMREHLNVDPRAVVNEIRFYRCGFGPNFEVFEYAPTPSQKPQPLNSDIGGH